MINIITLYILYLFITLTFTFKSNYNNNRINFVTNCINKDQISNPITNSIPSNEINRYNNKLLKNIKSIAAIAYTLGISYKVVADDAISTISTPTIDPTIKSTENVDWGSFKLPYNHENLDFKQFLGKATILFNMKIDDPQTVSQFPSLGEIYNKYKAQGLNVHAFPTEQGWFEPDDDETCRLKAEVYYGFGDYPHASVFDKIDILGPSSHPLYKALTNALPTPNGYSRITLNYEKFLLDSTGRPVRRYPRKYTAYDMEPDIVALLNDQPLPEITPLYSKAWREAKRESIKSEYAFRYNYNYYDSPESMYKYNPNKDKI